MNTELNMNKKEYKLKEQKETEQKWAAEQNNKTEINIKESIIEQNRLHKLKQISMHISVCILI